VSGTHAQGQDRNYIETLVVALGGNAIQSSGDRGTAADQLANVRHAMASIAELADRGYRVVLTHGNGPQVGTILLQQAAAEASEGIPAMPMDVAGAMSQGQIGYMMQQSLQNELRARGRPWPVATVVTQMVVDPNDPAFSNPTKPVGPFYSAEKGAELRAKGFTVIEDSGRGYRRVVPSPMPMAIAEIYAIRTLINSGALVICSGGGGVPVVRDDKGDLHGVEAVIDKDLGASLLAQKLDADRLLILTDVEKVAINYRKPDQRDLSRLALEEARQLIGEGHFASGSMGPKVRAAVSFVEAGGKQAIITHLHSALRAIAGETGTSIEQGSGVRGQSLPKSTDP
jgi:carbamate kinase